MTEPNDQVTLDKRRRNLDYPLGLSLEAVSAVVTLIRSDWGDEGYVIDNISPVTWNGSLVAEVRASDGSRFYVGSTKYGNTVHGEDEHEVAKQVQEAAVNETRIVRGEA